MSTSTISTVVSLCTCVSETCPHAWMRLPMFMHDLCFLHIVRMFAAYGLQARMPHRGVVLVLSVMLCSEGLKKVLVPGNPCSVHSCHLLSQHDPAWPWRPIVAPQKSLSPINPQLLLQGSEFTATTQLLSSFTCILPQLTALHLFQFVLVLSLKFQ